MTINAEICRNIRRKAMCCLCAGMGEDNCPMSSNLPDRRTGMRDRRERDRRCQDRREARAAAC